MKTTRLFCHLCGCVFNSAHKRCPFCVSARRMAAPKLARIVALVVIAFSVSALDLTETDKRQHMALSGGIALTMDLIAQNDTRHPAMREIEYRALYSLTLPILLGVAKEWSDQMGNGSGWCPQDLAADVIGAVGGFAAGEIYGGAVSLLLSKDSAAVGLAWRL